MNKLESARCILEAFKDGVKFLCLRDLAKNAGFQRASNRDFKEGFNYLVEKRIIKLQQSGWSSEKRKGKNHPATVILTANLYEIIDSDFEVDEKKIADLPLEVTGGVQRELPLKMLSESMKAKLRNCIDCQHSPIVFITMEKIPVCLEHWSSIASSDIEW